MINTHNLRRLVGVFLAASGVVLSVVASPAGATSSSPSPVDTSDAVRWDLDGSPIGDIVYEFVNGDDRTKNIDAPFPLNFFGERLPALCLSTNGLVHPIASVSSNCSPKFDKDLETLTAAAEASNIAALAIDLDPSEWIHNPHRESTEELQITSAVAASGTITVTTAEPHGFRVGELIYISSNPTFLVGVYRGRVDSVPSATTYTFTEPNPFTDGVYTPTVGARAVAYREVVLERVSGLSLAGTTLTVTTSSDVDFGVGGKFTFNGTGVAGLDSAKLLIGTRVDNRNFTVTVPAGITDVDATQAGDQTTMSFSSNLPWALERDEVGAIQQVYFGTTTVDGRDAYSITWYRMGTSDLNSNGINGGLFPAVNPETLSITLQLLIIKRDTGSDAVGWDFDYEFNFGHATDTSDGYHSDIPNTVCNTNDLTKCRWGIGTARLFPGAEVVSMSHDGTDLTVNTATAHGLTVGRSAKPSGLCDNPFWVCGAGIVSTIVDADTVTLSGASTTAFTEVAAPPGTRLGYAEAWELFPDNSVFDLSDSGGSTALVRNSLNSNVLGRYTFGMVGGQVTGFLKPTMGNGVSGTPPTTTPATTTPATTTPPATTPATTTPPASTPQTTAPTTPLPTLPATGNNLNGLLVGAFMLMLAGGVLITPRRRVR
jgi:LPXTG-motif cell wall-anchored protein